MALKLGQAEQHTKSRPLPQPSLENLSIVLPAKNEAEGLRNLLPELKALYPDAEVLVVSDGSSDETAATALVHGATVTLLPCSMGNGAAIKAGARAARGDVLLFMDGDAQHDPQDIKRLLAELERGYDMVVGARDASSHASLGRRLANSFYNRLASWMVGHPVLDLTSGLRVVKAGKFREFLHLLPNGFSYPTTITMAFFRAGYPVAYVPINARKRVGKSHIRLGKDGVRFLLIIFKIGSLYSPLKLFFPISAVFFLAGLFYYLHTYLAEGRFTNMSALLFSTSVLVFLIGLVSEQITMLVYKDSEK